MSINLQKGQKIDLTKGNDQIKKLIIGLGWDAVKKGTHNVDCDTSVLILDSNEKLKEMVYFGNKTSSNKSIMHSGDNLTGLGDGDDEVIVVDIPNLPTDVNKLMFVVNIYKCDDRNQDFGLVSNAYIRILNESTKAELARFNLSEDYAGRTALIAGEIYRYNGEWKFNALGQGTNDKSLKEMANKY